MIPGEARGTMQTVDLTQTISPRMPVYPGTEPPVFRRTNPLN